MPNPRPAPGTSASESRPIDAAGQASAHARPTEQGDGDQAAQGSRQPASAAAKTAPGGRTDSPAEAEGRRTLSTAFVMVGPDGHLIVELRDGRVMVLRDVVMRSRDYCGVHLPAGSPATRYCGGYGDVAAARPGGAPTPRTTDPATLDPVELGRSRDERE